MRVKVYRSFQSHPTPLELDYKTPNTDLMIATSVDFVDS